MTEQYHEDANDLEAFTAVLRAESIDPSTFAAAASKFLGDSPIDNKITNNDHATIQRAELIVFEMLYRDIDPYQINDAVFLKRLGKIMSIALTSSGHSFFKFENSDNPYFQNFNPIVLPENPSPLELREKLLAYGYHVCMATAVAGGFAALEGEVINLTALQDVYSRIINNKKLAYHSLGHAAGLAYQLRLFYQNSNNLYKCNEWINSEMNNRFWCIALAILDYGNHTNSNTNEHDYITFRLKNFNNVILNSDIIHKAQYNIVASLARTKGIRDF